MSTQTPYEAPKRDTCVLLGFADAASAPEAVWSLLAAGYAVVAYSRAGSRAALHRLVDVAEVASPEQDVEQTLADLRALATTVGASVALPLDDASIWLCARAFAGTSMRIAGPIGGNTDLALDKRLQLDAARSVGFEVPDTVVVESVETLAETPFTFPIIVKPALAARPVEGRLTRAAFRICSTRAELEEAAHQLPHDEPFLVQPRLVGVGRGVVGIASHGETMVTSGHERIRMMNPLGSGSSACRSWLPSADSLERTARMLADTEWDGLYMVELLADKDGNEWFMELNGRAWGSLALSRRQGLEYPAWAVARALDPSFLPEAPAELPSVTCRHLGRELLHLLFVFRGAHADQLPDWPTRWSTLRSICRIRPEERWYNYQRDERRFFVEDTLRTVGAQLRKPRR